LIEKERKEKKMTKKERNGKERKGKEKKREAKTTTKNDQNHIMIECNDMIDCLTTTKERER
jgi:hypothetical protein